MRVGQIGTGSTGIQAAPAIAGTAKHLTVFQRTAKYSVPARNAPLDEAFRHRVRESYEAIREVVALDPQRPSLPHRRRNAFDVGAEERQAIYEAAWQKGGLQFRASFRDLVLDRRGQRDRRRIHQEEDPRDRARPEDRRDARRHRPSLRREAPADRHRLLRDLQPRQRRLVDLRAEPIERITAAGIRTRAREYPLDILVFATGFDAMTGPLFGWTSAAAAA